MSANILQDKENTSSTTKHLQSEIINQKKQFIFKIEQTSDFVYPNECYKYYIYLKNISGVDINNIHVIVNNPDVIAIDQTGENPIEIGTMKNGEVKLIYLNSECTETGTYYTHFICYGDGTGLFHKTLRIDCSYNNVSNEIIHKIHIYDFSPYENTYRLEVDDYNNEVTQLFKRQKLPYKAKQQPFPIKIKNNEATIEPFNNVESSSFIEQFYDTQHDLPENYNNDEHHYSYIGRENFNANSVESFVGKNLNEIIDNINQNSQYFKAIFLKTGTNQLLNDFKEYNPDGFIYRFGLLGSEIYHNIGVLPTYSYMSDYLFRWAPSKNQPLNLIPQKKAMIWDENKWAGHGWRVYRIATKEYMATPEWQNDFDAGRVNRWDLLETFNDLESAESYLERRQHNDDIIEAQLSLDYDMYTYLITESFYDTGVFYVNIPLDKIPTNFYLLGTEEIKALIQRSKPFGVKPLIRYMIERTFNDEIEFTHYPTLKPHIDINMGDMNDISYFITSKKYKEVTEQICGVDINKIKLVPFGKAVNYNMPFEESILFRKESFLPRVVYTNPINETGPKKNPTKYNQYKLSPNTKKTPDNNFNIEIEQEKEVTPTLVDNNVNNLFDIADILYQNNADNIGFYLNSNLYHRLILKSNANTTNNFISEWAKNQNYTVYSYAVNEYSTEKVSGLRVIDDEQGAQYNTFKISNPNKNEFMQGDKEIGIGLLDSSNKYHYLTMKYDNIHKKTYLKYSTSFNNQYTTKKDGMKKNIDGLVITTIKIGFKQLVIFFVNDDSQNLHYFHHIIISNISDIFIFASNTFTKKQNGAEIEFNVQDAFSCALLRNQEIIFELPYIEEYNAYETYIIKDGDNWTNLYRIDKAENSYTYIHNKDNQILDVDKITLHYDNLNIPDNVSIKAIKLKSLINSSASSEIYCKCGVQGNLNFEEANGNAVSFKPNYIEFYPQQSDSQFILNNKLNVAQENNNETLTDKYKRLIIKNILFDESINITTKDFLTNQNDYMTLKHCYWSEISNFTYERFNTNNIEKIEFIIEGYNKSNELDMISQLCSENDNTEEVKTKIESGYFYKKISMPFLTSFRSDELRLRYKFNDLVDEINIFNVYINIIFKNKEDKDLILIDTDSAIIHNKDTIAFDCFIENITPEEMNNGFTIQLDFDSLSPGDFYRIYFAELEIIYEYMDSTILINKNKFNYVSYDEAYTVVSGVNDNTYLSGLFYNDVASAIQSESNINIDNHGIELKEKLYQSFIATENNITSVELYPNGFIGNPDSTLKIGLYSNHGNTPYKLIKEVYASGWTKANSELKNLYSIKYNLNVDNLIINEKYWIKVEVENPSEDNYYLLRYTTNKKDNFTLLLQEHNNYINTFGALEFNIYSRNLTRSFAQLPTVQDYFNNPYIMIGLHKKGEIKKLKVKRKGVTHE